MMEKKGNTIGLIELKYRYKIQLENLVHKHIMEELKYAASQGIKNFRRN